MTDSLETMPARARALFAALGLRFDPDAMEPIRERRSDTRKNRRFVVTVETTYWQEGDGELTTVHVSGDNGATSSRDFERLEEAEAYLTVAPWDSTLTFEGSAKLTLASARGPRAEELRQAWLDLPT